MYKSRLPRTSLGRIAGALAGCALGAAVSILLLNCGGESSPPASGLHPAPPHDAGDAGDAADDSPQDPCAVPDAGCPCDTPGEQVVCDKTEIVIGGVPWCYQGERTCGDAGTWGDCIDDS